MKNLALYAVLAIVIYLVYIKLTAKIEKPVKSVVPTKPMSNIKFIETELEKKRKFILQNLLEVKKMKKNNVNPELIRLKEKELDNKYPNLQVNLKNPKNRIIAEKISSYSTYPSTTYNPKKASIIMAEMV